MNTQVVNAHTICVNDEGHPIVRYTYKDGNGRLKQVTYDNGDKMKIGYNRMGQMISERWFDAEDVLTAHYRYSYDNNGNIVRSLDIFAQKEYSYTYEEGRLMRAVECDVTLNGEIVIDRNLVNTILYTYDAEGSLTWKRIIPAVGDETALCYGSDANGNTTVQCSVNNFDMVSLSQVDSLGRKKCEELHVNDAVLARQFTYHEGNIPDEHTQNNKVKSAPTTQLVKTITLPDGRTLTYEYDREERITKVTDSLEGVTEYAYDCFGQLRRETLDGVVVNEMSYDWYGNITAKNRMVYGYGIGVWKDLLTHFAGRGIGYDGVGNPVYYQGNTLIWEKGRQLKEFIGTELTVNYTYNANGIRTSKTVNGVKHTYTLDGTKILREAWGNNVLIPLYDVEETPCGIVYSGTPYYFLKNLQGDIITIVSENGETVARYRYDAWGNCTVSSESTNLAVANANPIRYRGYYYDSDTGLYYCNARYYSPKWRRFISPDDTAYLDPETVNGLNLYCYCNNDPINFVDYSGHSIIAIALSVLAVAGLITSGIGVATDNNTLTAIGLTMVAVPAIISGIGAIATGATYLGIIGGVTCVAGMGSTVFAATEYIEAFTGNNWMINAGMSEEWYNRLLLTTATIATCNLEKMWYNQGGGDGYETGWCDFFGIAHVFKLCAES